MKSKGKNLVIALVLLVMVGISLGYAAISSNVNINGTTDIQKNTWSVIFKDVSVTTGSVTPTTAAAVQTDKTKVKFDVDLSKPGDFYEFTVVVKNAGTLDAMVSEVVKSGLSTTQAVYTNYTVTYNDKNSTAIKKCDTIAAGDTKTLKVRVEYRTDITALQLPTETQNLSLTFNANFVQATSSCSA